MRIHIVFLLAFAVLFSACNTSKSGDSNGGSSYNEDLKNLSRAKFDMGNVSFSVADIPGLTKVNRDSVGWATYLPQTAENAPIVYYFMDMKRTLSAPHVRLEYIDKQLDLMGSTESIFNWLKGLYINPEQQGQIIEEGEKVRTMDGQEVEILAIKRPEVAVNDTLMRGLKLMAWAYVDHNDRYVAMNFSATDQADFEEGMPQFKDLVRSYHDE